MARTKRRDAGTGAVYQRADGYYVASLDLGWVDGKRRRKRFVARTKAAVVAKLKEARKQLDDTGTVASNVPTVHTWLRRWLDEIAAVKVKPRTLAGYRTTVERHIAPHIGRHRLDRLTAAHVLAMQTALRSTTAKRGGAVAESTVLKAHAVLSKALGDAQRLGLLTRNVATMVDRPSARRPKTARRELTAHEALAVLRTVADDPLGSRWAAALMLGARQGECLGLEWDRVDLDDGIVDLAWQLQRLPYRHGCGGECGRKFAGDCPNRALRVPPGYEHRVLTGALALTRPKTDRPRVVPVPAPLLAWLRRRREENPHPLVWCRDDGQPIDPRQDYEAWKATLAAADLAPVPLHSARHTTASLLLSIGVPEPVIMAILGHSVITTTRGYAHVDQTLARAAMERLGERLAIEG